MLTTIPFSYATQIDTLQSEKSFLQLQLENALQVNRLFAFSICIC